MPAANLTLRDTVEDAWLKITMGADGQKATKVPVGDVAMMVAAAVALQVPFGMNMTGPGEDAKGFADRVCALADINHDDFIEREEFDMLWRHLPNSKQADLLRKEAFMSASGLEFDMGGLADWEAGLPGKLKGLIRNSVETECKWNCNKRYWESYKYITREKAQPFKENKVDAFGREVVFDEGHENMWLDDFVRLANDLPRAPGVAAFTRVEVAMLRCYTWHFFRPWNNALRGLDDHGNPDGGRSLGDWATCIAVLFQAVYKLSQARGPPADAGSGVGDDANPRASVAAGGAGDGAPRKVYRGLREDKSRLPQSFFTTREGEEHAGGTERSFMSTSHNIWMAYTYSGGWDVPGTILELTTNKTARGADLSFLSCYPGEEELLLAPFTFMTVVGQPEERGHKRFIRCSLQNNPGKIDVGQDALDDFTAEPSMRAKLEGVSEERMDEARFEISFGQQMRSAHPEFIDPFTDSSVMKNPVEAADKRSYEEESLKRWISEAKAHGRKLTTTTTKNRSRLERARGWPAHRACR